MFNIKGKVVILTGAAGGIGLAIAKSFAGLGARLTLIDKSEGFEDIIAQQIKNPAFEPLILRADLRNERDIERVVRETENKWGRIDILINNAAVNVRKKIDEYTSEEWDWILNVNLKAVFILTNKVAKVMKKKSYGKIINISSMQGVICWAPGESSLAPYSASKAGLIALTKAFALNLARHNITVNAVCPAVVDGKWAKGLKDDPIIYKDIISRTPLGRLAKNSDLIGPVLFLATDASSYVTGHALLVDGGWTIQ